MFCETDAPVAPPAEERRAFGTEPPGPLTCVQVTPDVTVQSPELVPGEVKALTLVKEPSVRAVYEAGTLVLGFGEGLQGEMLTQTDPEDVAAAEAELEVVEVVEVDAAADALEVVDDVVLDAAAVGLEEDELVVVEGVELDVVEAAAEEVELDVVEGLELDVVEVLELVVAAVLEVEVVDVDVEQAGRAGGESQMP